MNRFLIILVLILVVIGCLGFYMGWFRIGSESSDGKTHVTFTVDQNKFKADENKAVEKVRGGGQQESPPPAPVQPPENAK